MSGDEPREYGLVLPFDTDDVEFVRGWALGEIWGRLKHEPGVHAVVYTRSAEMVIRIAEHYGLPFKATVYDETWTEVTIGTPVEQEV